ncbi:MAG: hypothetical protein HUK13_03045 [Muribaculaceae bacterium]|nr:hypothetical protein [Muribaculaceae bacterium]
MKKIAYSILAVAALALASCAKEEPGMTATEPLAGQWYVTFDAVDKDGNLLEADPYSMGRVITATFNTSANTSNQMWVSDLGNFCGYQVKVNCDVTALTFSTADWADNYSYGNKAKVSDGRVLKGAATTPSGMSADSIVYYIQFSDATEIFRVSGFRYTGFVEDN